MQKTKVLFFSGMNINYSVGEFQQIISFNQDLDTDKFITKIIIKRTKIFHFPYNNIDFYEDENLNEFINYLNDFKPDIIIMSEYQHTPENFIDYLNQTDIILASMDHGSKIEERYKPKNIIYIKPCPINDPAPNSRYKKYWNIHNQDYKVCLKDQLITNLNLEKNSKIVFISIAPWAYKISIFNNTNGYYPYLINLLIDCLKDQDFPVNLFFLSLTKIKDMKINNVNCVFIEKLKSEQYQDILLNSDLVISDNISQLSMAKAFMKNIKVLALQNTLDIELDFMDCFSFNSFPMDIEKTSFFDNYKYSRVIDRAEVFDESDVKDKITYLLNEENNINLEQQNYIKSCESLLSPSEILEEIVLENTDRIIIELKAKE